jgi:3-oxoadipate enol-lactonase
MPFIKANNANFYYELHGTGHPLVLITGYTGDHAAWLPVLDGLSKHFQVLVFDNRASGQTTDAGDSLQGDVVAQDVIALVAQLDLEKPHIVAHSMGGSIAQVVAGAYPEKIGHVALLTSSAKWRPAIVSGFKSLLMMREKNVDFDIFFDNLVSWIFGSTFLQNEQELALLKKAVIENPYPQSVADNERQYKMLKAFDGNVWLSKIRARTLIVSGVQDLISLPYESQHLTRQISGAKQLEFDCAHGIMFEMPKRLVNTLVEFLK